MKHIRFHSKHWTHGHAQVVTADMHAFMRHTDSWVCVYVCVCVRVCVLAYHHFWKALCVWKSPHFAFSSSFSPLKSRNTWLLSCHKVSLGAWCNKHTHTCTHAHTCTHTHYTYILVWLYCWKCILTLAWSQCGFVLESTPARLLDSFLCIIIVL